VDDNNYYTAQSEVSDIDLFLSKKIFGTLCSKFIESSPGIIFASFSKSNALPKEDFVKSHPTSHQKPIQLLDLEIQSKSISNHDDDAWLVVVVLNSVRRFQFDIIACDEEVYGKLEDQCSVIV
jgi:hypothetical protein